MRLLGARLVAVSTLTVLLLATPQPASAHFATVAFLELHITPEGLTGRLLLDPHHLAAILPLDADGDGDITAAEVAAVAPEVRDLADGALVARVAGAPLPQEVGAPALTRASTLGDHGVSVQPGFPLIEVPIVHEAPQRLVDFTLSYDLFLDPAEGTGTHQAFALLDLDGTVLRHAFGPATPTLSAGLPAGASPATVMGVVGAVLGLIALLPLAARSLRAGEGTKSGSPVGHPSDSPPTDGGHRSIKAST